jgi:hypothetical protein
MRWRAAIVCLAVLALAACSDDPDTEQPATSSEERAARPAPERPSPAPQASRCPDGLTDCRTASGRILYVERVDPDGDGDAHFVLLSDESVTAPGISVIDVKASLRPSPLPGPGDHLSAAGPVYRGSYGQRQIEAIELHVARAG